MVKIINIEIPVIVEEDSTVISDENVKIVIERTDDAVILTKLDSNGRDYWYITEELARKLKETL